MCEYITLITVEIIRKIMNKLGHVQYKISFKRNKASDRKPLTGSFIT
jgi:hypothetical protein